MKKLLVLPLLVSLVSAQAAVYEDFRKGLDATAFTTLTAARLNQMIDNGTVNTNKGLVLITNGTPNTASFPHYTNFLWLDISTQPPVLKLYTSAGGGAWNSVGLGTTNVTTDKIADGAVTTAKIANDAVDITKISNNAVSSSKIQDGAVTRAKIGTGAVWPEHFNTGAVGDAALTNAQIVGTSRIVDWSVTREKIAAGAINNTLLTNNAVTAGFIAAGAVYGTNIVDATITSTNIANYAVTTNQLSSQVNTYLGLTLKAGGFVTTAGGTPTLTRSHNIASVAYGGAGLWTVTFSNQLSTANYFVNFMPMYNGQSANDNLLFGSTNHAVGSFQMVSATARTGAYGSNALSGFSVTVFE